MPRLICSLLMSLPSSVTVPSMRPYISFFRLVTVTVLPKTKSEKLCFARLPKSCEDSGASMPSRLTLCCLLLASRIVIVSPFRPEWILRLAGVLAWGRQVLANSLLDATARRLMRLRPRLQSLIRDAAPGQGSVRLLPAPDMRLLNSPGRACEYANRRHISGRSRRQAEESRRRQTRQRRERRERSGRTQLRQVFT